MALKSFEEILEKDGRHDFTSAGDPEDPWRRITFREFYDRIASLNVDLGVSGDIAEMFDRARLTFVYSWFAYELSVMAEQHAMQMVEAALRERYPLSTRPGLRRLMALAVADGLLSPGIPAAGGVSLETIVSSRNHWAHGVNGFGSPTTALDMLRCCADIVSRLAQARR